MFRITAFAGALLFLLLMPARAAAVLGKLILIDASQRWKKISKNAER